ncbi:predicted protein [Meyerozyma guilliermondii ATCC 6260]|uniref:Uncharacterized protein n=1 Tax=Meyerozyma guilliermondii (strain ATCC 6260 / CBS 566 / DSM 6381 / JCM 1539 / NBRC 10279 / NRRL Y-324) TaxID=294746 RepID=A5DJC0_PICGU|nr:uncharacterized protein PGUG_03371 [Meyerozyma guilliermondii ATCC 6260]EDK39273.2 predicted protein [Meyerozyma guilliermondii ATCC 6260]
MTTPPTEEYMTSLLSEGRTSRTMEQRTIVTAPETGHETPLETPLFSLTNSNQVRAALSLSISVFPLVKPGFGVEEVDLPPLAWFCVILAYMVFTINRFLGIRASKKRNEPMREYMLSKISFVGCIVVLGIAFYFCLRSGNPAKSELVALCQLTILTGMLSSNKALLNNFMPYFEEDRN